VATGGFCFEKVEGGKATPHVNGKEKSCRRVWFTELQALLTRGEVRGHHGSHRTNIVVSIAGPKGNAGAVDCGDADVRFLRLVRARQWRTHGGS
jgi:hypothetical protein